MDWIWLRLSLMSSETRMTLQRLISRSYSAGETLTRSATFHALSPTYHYRQEGCSAQQRRTTIGWSAAIMRTVTLMLCYMCN